MIATIRFLALTGLRMGEALALRWSYVNLATGSLDLPESKTGPKLVSLGASAVELLASLPRMANNDHAFPGIKPGRTPKDEPRARAAQLLDLMEAVRVQIVRNANEDPLVASGSCG